MFEILDSDWLCDEVTSITTHSFKNFLEIHASGKLSQCSTVSVSFDKHRLPQARSAYNFSRLGCGIKGNLCFISSVICQYGGVPAIQDIKCVFLRREGEARSVCMCSLQQEILIANEIHDGEGQTVEQDQVFERKLRFQAWLNLYRSIFVS